MLQINHFSKTYPNGKKAVEDCCIHVKKGDLYGFIGHNGAGKTTTLKAVAGILDFSEGEIKIDGHSIKDEPLLCKKEFAYIPDNPDIYENLTGIQYLNFIADIFEVSDEKRKKEIEYLAKELEIERALNDVISSYSHGMKQKLVLISALIHDPKLLILDEPFVGLDPKASMLVKKIMHEHCEKGGAVFFSTHVLDVAEKLCNQVAIIKNGRIVACGSMEEVRGQESLEDVFMEILDHE